MVAGAGNSVASAHELRKQSLEYFRVASFNRGLLEPDKMNVYYCKITGCLTELWLYTAGHVAATMTFICCATQPDKCT